MNEAVLTAEGAEDAEIVKRLNELTEAIIGSAMEVHRALLRVLCGK